MKKVVRAKEVANMLSVCKATIYNWLKKGSFPEPIKIGDRVVGWPVDLIEKWLEEKGKRDG